MSENITLCSFNRKQRVFLEKFQFSNSIEIWACFWNGSYNSVHCKKNTTVYVTDGQWEPAKQHKELHATFCDNLHGKRIWKRMDMYICIIESQRREPCDIGGMRLEWRIYKPTRSWKRQREAPPPEPLEGTWSCPNLNFRLLASGTMKG